MRGKRWFLLLLVFSLAFSMIACSTEETAKEPGGDENGTKVEATEFTGKYIVDADYVKEHYEDDNVILLDARGEEATKKGTIEGAITTTWQNLSNIENAKKGDYDWGLILEPEILSKKLGELV